jgi:hypothetical protein
VVDGVECAGQVDGDHDGPVHWFFFVESGSDVVGYILKGCGGRPAISEPMLVVGQSY